MGYIISRAKCEKCGESFHRSGGKILYHKNCCPLCSKKLLSNKVYEYLPTVVLATATILNPFVEKGNYQTNLATIKSNCLVDVNDFHINRKFRKKKDIYRHPLAAIGSNAEWNT